MDTLNSYKQDLKKAIDQIPLDIINQISDHLLKVRKSGNCVYLIGNGGSSATPSHSAGDWSKELHLKSFCLSDNTAALTAYANDLHYDDVFIEQLKVFLDVNDIVIAYSGSGNSINVIKAIEYANSIGALTIGITGNYKKKSGGKIAKIVSIKIVVDSENMEIIEDCHLIINHMIKELIKIKNKY